MSYFPEPSLIEPDEKPIQCPGCLVMFYASDPDTWIDEETLTPFHSEDCFKDFKYELGKEDSTEDR